MIGLGPALNAAGIVLGSVAGLTRRRPLSLAFESWLKLGLGVFTVFCGLRLTWLSLSGPWLHLLKQLVITLLALMLGHLLGRLLRLQSLSNRLGRAARERIAAAKPTDPHRAGEGFKACLALFCAAPLGILGAMQDGLSGYAWPLAAKGVMDGLAAFGFVSVFGWGVLLSAVPVLALQGSITLLCAQFLEPFLRAHGLVAPINAVGGLLVFSVALVILEIKRLELANYLPSLLVAPLIASLWR